jgi:hypothetical protein
MSWSGIFLVHVPDGVDPQDAVDATVAAWITWDGEGLSVEENTDPPIVESDPGWSQLARDVLLGVNPHLQVVDPDGTLDDGVGPVWISVYPDEVQLKPKKAWHGDNEVDGFATMWGYCVALGLQAQCVAHDSEEDGFLDLSLDVETARTVYNWL